MFHSFFKSLTRSWYFFIRFRFLRTHSYMAGTAKSIIRHLLLSISITICLGLVIQEHASSGQTNLIISCNSHFQTRHLTDISTISLLHLTQIGYRFPNGFSYQSNHVDSCNTAHFEHSLCIRSTHLFAHASFISFSWCVHPCRDCVFFFFSGGWRCFTLYKTIFYSKPPLRWSKCHLLVEKPVHVADFLLPCYIASPYAVSWLQSLVQHFALPDPFPFSRSSQMLFIRTFNITSKSQRSQWHKVFKTH